MILKVIWAALISHPSSITIWTLYALHVIEVLLILENMPKINVRLVIKRRKNTLMVMNLFTMVNSTSPSCLPNTHLNPMIPVK